MLTRNALQNLTVGVQAVEDRLAAYERERNSGKSTPLFHASTPSNPTPSSGGSRGNDPELDDVEATLNGDYPPPSSPNAGPSYHYIYGPLENSAFGPNGIGPIARRASAPLQVQAPLPFLVQHPALPFEMFHHEPLPLYAGGCAMIRERASRGRPRSTPPVQRQWGEGLQSSSLPASPMSPDSEYVPNAEGGWSRNPVWNWGATVAGIPTLMITPPRSPRLAERRMKIEIKGGAGGEGSEGGDGGENGADVESEDGLK